MVATTVLKAAVWSWLE